MTYFLSYGLLNGKLNGGGMRRLLKNNGYQPADAAEDADIIIAHSAGCWRLPQKVKAKLVFYIGLPLAEPSMSTSMKNAAAVARDFLINRNIRGAVRYYMFAWIYGLIQPRRNIMIVRNAKRSRFQDYKNRKIIMISNRDDIWTRLPDFTDFCEQHKDWAFLSLPGSHDNIWQRPEKYVDIINAFAGRGKA